MTRRWATSSNRCLRRGNSRRRPSFDLDIPDGPPRCEGSGSHGAVRNAITVATVWPALVMGNRKLGVVPDHLPFEMLPHLTTHAVRVATKSSDLSPELRTPERFRQNGCQRHDLQRSPGFVRDEQGLWNTPNTPTWPEGRSKSGSLARATRDWVPRGTNVAAAEGVYARFPGSGSPGRPEPPSLPNW